VIKDLDGFSLDRKIRAAGRNFLFMAVEVKGMIFSTIGAKNVQSAVKSRFPSDVRLRPQESRSCAVITHCGSQEADNESSKSFAPPGV
jgi:hypothetical protein